MDEDEIARYIRTRFFGILPVAAWGETSFFYNPGQALAAEKFAKRVAAA